MNSSDSGVFSPSPRESIRSRARTTTICHYDKKQVADLETQFLELLFELPPSERSPSHDNLRDAIAAHVDSFSDFWSEGWSNSPTE